MPGLVPGIHVLATRKIVDGRVKPGHDEVQVDRATVVMPAQAGIQ